MARKQSYDEIFDRIWQDVDGHKRIAQLPKGERVAFRVLEFLSTRKGFDWWFEEIDAECRTEIFYAIAELITKGDAE